MNIFYAHSGGVTAVINTSAAGVIKTGKDHEQINNIYVGKDGLLGLLNDQLYDVSQIDDDTINRISQQPGSVFGSCRFKLKDLEQDHETYERIIKHLAKHQIEGFIYNGGNDSQDTTQKIAIMAKTLGVNLTCIGIPKTIDNDLMGTDCCPGFASAAKYLATSCMEASLDVKSMAKTSTKVFILEVMGRHTGWLAASCTLAKKTPHDPPHIVLIPEVAFDMNRFITQVNRAVESYGYCTIVASEGLKNEQGDRLCGFDVFDAFGHQQLGGIGHYLAKAITTHTGYKNHVAIADYLQRSAGHLRAQVDVDQAYAAGKQAVLSCVKGQNSTMMSIKAHRDNHQYQWSIAPIDLSVAANHERFIEQDMLDQHGQIDFKKFQHYALPLIQGEVYPDYRDGLASYDYDLATRLPLVNIAT